MRPYVYKPLSSRAETRVIDLEPAQDKSAPLCCSLHELNIHDDEGYHAVSYTWGAPTFTEPLIVDEEYIIYMTPNSRDALRRFRPKYHRRRLWIDAICINQEDEREKNRQLPCMGRIYRGASSVLIWLGDYPRGALCLRTISDFARKRDLDPEDDATIAYTVRTITKLPWFRRRWVVQEAVLNADNLLCCGDEEISWPRFAQILTRIDSKTLPDLRPLRTMIDLWTSWVLRSGRDSGLAILPLLASFDSLGCADDRDRIYSLMGLACDVHPISQGQHGSEGHIDLRVNYENDTRIVYIDFAKSVVARDQGTGPWPLLDQVAARRNSRKPDDEFPSWVPDWRAPIIRTPFSELKFDKYVRRPVQFADDVSLTYDTGRSSVYIAERLGAIISVTDVSDPIPEVSRATGIKAWFQNVCMLFEKTRQKLEALEGKSASWDEKNQPNASDQPSVDVRATRSVPVNLRAVANFFDKCFSGDDVDWSEPMLVVYFCGVLLYSEATDDEIESIARDGQFMSRRRIFLCHYCSLYRYDDSPMETYYLGIGPDYMDVGDTVIPVSAYEEPWLKHGNEDLTYRGLILQPNYPRFDQYVYLGDCLLLDFRRNHRSGRCDLATSHELI